MVEHGGRRFVPEGNLKPQEREKNPESQKDGRTYSKNERQSERDALAREVRGKRSELLDQRKILQLRIKMVKEAVERHDVLVSDRDALTEQYRQARNRAADSIMDRTRSFLGLRTKEEVYKGPVERSRDSGLELKYQLADLKRELQEAEQELVESDQSMDELRGKIESFKAAAEQAKQVTIQQAMRDNGVFFVHSFTPKRVVDTKSQNVSEDITDAERLSLLLALEPSISASSIRPGSGEELISAKMGVLVGGGDISFASPVDAGTTAYGIQKRGIEKTDSFGALDASYDGPTPEQLGKAVRREGAEENWRGWNEFVVDRPKILGLYVAAQENADGRMSAVSSWKKGTAAEKERSRFNELKDAGMPYYAMVPDGRFFEVVSYGDDHTLELGEEFTPEQAADAPAGLSPERRIQVGERLLDGESSILKNEKDLLEVRTILSDLSGES
jgi:hypothetical protein